MGASSVRRQQIYRTTDQEDDDCEPTTMAPIASELIAAMMNDVQDAEIAIPHRPSGFRARENGAPVPMQAPPDEEPTPTARRAAHSVTLRDITVNEEKKRRIDATEIGIFLMSFSLTAVGLLYAFFG